MNVTDNPSREAILGRIRSALANTAPLPEAPRGTRVFPEVTDTMNRFQQECAGNLVECVVTADEADSAQALATLLSSLPDGGIFVEDDTDLRALVDASFRQTPGREVQWSTQGRAAESAQATVTTAELLVAATGSICVSSSRGGRAGSVVAPCHIVFAHEYQLVPDLEAAMSRLYAADAPDRNSFVGLVTGSSRTADIEKILVLGAHGPRRVAVLVQKS